MTLNDLLGAVVNQLQNDENDLNGADAEHPTHGSDLLAKFKAAQAAASSDPNADLGQVFGQVSQAIAGSSSGFTSKAYGDAFAEGAQAFSGRNNQLGLDDLGPIIGMLTNGFSKHDTRGTNAAGPLGALAPLLGLLGGGQGGGLDIGKIAGMLLGGGAAGGIGGLLGGLLGGGQQQGGGLGGMLGGLLGGGQQPQAQQQQDGGLGGLLGGLLGGGQQQPQAQQQGGGLGDLVGGLLGGGQGNSPLGALLGAVTQGAQMTNANGQRDAGAASTGSVLTGLLGALLK
jgi:hypothetical protein